MATLVTLPETKVHLGITSDSDDAEIMAMVEAVTEPIELIVGSVLPAAYTERYDGGRAALALAHRPVLSVTSVTLPGGATVTAAGYELDADAGVLTRMAGGYRWAWESGRITIAYTAGLAAVPKHVRLAALITVKHMWETQRGGQRDQRFTGNSEESWNPRWGYTLPRRALELLGNQNAGIA
ncbi:hypothetical protein [Nonomuraea dietziae]|uniref:hypothetical protein n=1 Tax=Nonomuraea dietziae TaxID=65515 RepID=UPI00343699CE